MYGGIFTIVLAQLEELRAFALYAGDRGSKQLLAINRQSLEQVVTEHVPRLRCELHGGPHEGLRNESQSVTLSRCGMC